MDVTVSFPSGRGAEALCPVGVAHLLWADGFVQPARVSAGRGH